MKENRYDPRSTAPMSRIVRAAIVAVTIVLFFASSFHALLGHRDVAVMLALATPLGISAWGFARAGHNQAAMLLLCGVLVTVATLILMLNPLGFHDVAVATYVGVALLAALLLPRGTFAAVAVLVILGAGAAFAADALGRSRSEVTGLSGWPQFAILVVMVTVFSGLGRVIAAHLFGGLGEAHRASLTDALTGLGNRAGFLAEATARLDAARARGEGGVLVAADIDDFRRLNLVVGREAADRLLGEAARRLRAAGVEHLAGRIGDDEFAVLALGVPEERAAGVARDVHGCLDFDFHGVQVRNSCGYARFPRDGDDVDALLLAAQGGVAGAKGGGRSRLGEPPSRI